MKSLLIALMTLGSLSSFASELPKKLNCKFEVVALEKQGDKIERVRVQDSLTGIGLPYFAFNLDGNEFSSGETYIGLSGVKIVVNGNPDEAKVQLYVSNGTKESEVLLLDQTIEPRSGLFEVLSVPSDRMVISYGNYSTKFQNVILSCLPHY